MFSTENKDAEKAHSRDGLGIARNALLLSPMIKFEMPKESMYLPFSKNYSIQILDEPDSIKRYYHLTTTKKAIAYIIIIMFM